ncbi:hypothetical protein GF325_06395 [Candidatus Bathyarchaeota archaeon]|nr:hypothetical protein [Candidatus Bathyarchaeota archaeon]
MPVDHAKQWREITVAVPHRISGFFEIVDQAQVTGTSLQALSAIGSRGGGPCLSALGTTKITIDKQSGMPPRVITIDGKECTNLARTSKSVMDLLPFQLPADVSIAIDHEFSLPTGAGFGSSGCGALGVAIGLNVLFHAGLSMEQCGQVAHCAEVLNKTGLGTVGGQLNGGCTITMAPGYPFTMNKIIVSPCFKIACASQGGILTSSILTDPCIRDRIIKAGKKSMKEIVEGFTIQNFTRLSREFVQCTGMLDIDALDLGSVKQVMEELNGIDSKHVIGASMNQLGKSAFCIFLEGEGVTGEIKRIFERNGFTGVHFLEFNDHGPRIVHLA